jgi:acyl carrier protein
MQVTLEDIRRLVSLQLGLANVQGSDRLMEELGAESVDIVNIIAAVEEKYGVFINEEELPRIQSVKDLHGLASRLLAGD